MRSFIAASLFIAALASAQSLSDLPACAQGCFASSIGETSCALTDTTCLCKDTKFQGVLVTCVQGACSADEQAKVTGFSTKSCAGVGVTIGASSAASVASSAAASGSSAAASASAVLSSVSSAVSSVAASASAAAKPSGSSNSGAGQVATGGILAAAGVVVALLL